MESQPCRLVAEGDCWLEFDFSRQRERQNGQRKADERSLFKENFNEKGEKYSMIWNNEDFRKVHDPIGNII